MEILRALINFILGCHHRRVSRFFSISGRTNHLLFRLRGDVQLLDGEYVHAAMA